MLRVLLLAAVCGLIILAGAALPGSTADADRPPDTTAADLAADGDGVDSLAAPPLPASLPGPVPYGVGERLVYDIDYGVVNAGEGVLEVKEVLEADGHACYRIETKATSNRFFSAFYKVRDRATSYIDVRRLFSRYFSKRLREGTFKRNVAFTFDQTAGKVYYADGREFDIIPGSHDIISAFYWVRTLDLEPGQEYFITTHNSTRNYDLRVIVHRRERVKVPAGEFDCIVVQPVILGEGLFKHEGDMVIWLTEDENRMPVKMKSKVTVGSVDVSLKEYQMGRPLDAAAYRKGEG